MATTTTTTGRPTATRTAMAGLLLATLAVLAIIPARGGDDVGFVLVVAPLLLLTTFLIWRFGLPAHVWAAVLGLLLVLMFGSYSFADLVDGAEVPILLIDLAVTAGGALTLYGAVALVIGRRRASRDQRFR